MKKLNLSFATLLLLVAGTAVAQKATDPDDNQDANSLTKIENQKKYGCREPKVQHFRPFNECGINVFEPPKQDDVPFTGFQLQWSGAFAQPFQALENKNRAVPVIVNGVDTTATIPTGAGFNLAGANLAFDVQLADGIRSELTIYLASRHHEDTWVKDGYALIDKVPFNAGPLNSLWSQYLTLKVGHFEINYGDQHFRRTDNGQSMYNPFIGNMILDAFTTEVGGELYLRARGAMAMFSVTGGEIKGNVLTPNQRLPAFITKIGFDRMVTPRLRVRMTGSNYINRKSAANTLYTGDRGGSPYYFALESVQTTDFTVVAWSGRIDPGFGRRVTAWQYNPFITYRGFEFFGIVEKATGLSPGELVLRTWHQYDGEAVYRFAKDKFYVGARYNWAGGNLRGITPRVSSDRKQFAAGWFILPYLELKGEYVVQNYHGFPITDLRYGGQFKGPIIHAVLAF